MILAITACIIIVSLFVRLIAINPFMKRGYYTNLALNDWVQVYIAQHYSTPLGSKTLVVEALSLSMLFIGLADLSILPAWASTACVMISTCMHLYICVLFSGVLYYAKQSSKAIQRDEPALFTQSVLALEQLSANIKLGDVDRFHNTSLSPHSLFDMLKSQKKQRIYEHMLCFFESDKPDVAVRMYLRDFFSAFGLSPVANINPEWPDATKRIALSITPEEEVEMDKIVGRFGKFKIY